MNGKGLPQRLETPADLFRFIFRQQPLFYEHLAGRAVGISYDVDALHRLAYLASVYRVAGHLCDIPYCMDVLSEQLAVLGHEVNDHAVAGERGQHIVLLAGVSGCGIGVAAVALVVKVGEIVGEGLLVGVYSAEPGIGVSTFLQVLAYREVVDEDRSLVRTGDGESGLFLAKGRDNELALEYRTLHGQ